MNSSTIRVSKPQPMYHRNDISDQTWALLEPHLSGRKGTWGGIAHDNRTFINAVFWILRTEAPWRDLPPDYGDWKNTHRRFCRWRDKGLWEPLLEVLIDEPGYEWLIINSSYIKIHSYATGVQEHKQSMERTKGNSTPRYIWPWMRLVCRSEALLQRVPGRIASKLAP